jgi:glycosyltransferase involved in cell wall biosynthesis
MKVAILYFGKSVFTRERAYHSRDVVSRDNDVLFIEMGENGNSFVRRFFIEMKAIYKIYRMKINVVHLHDQSFLLPFFMAPLKRKGTIFVYDTGNIHSKTVEIQGHSKLIVSLVRFAEKLTIKNSNYVISRGIYLKQILENIRGKIGWVYYIPDPVNVKALKDIPVDLARDRVGISKDKFVIGYTSNMVQIKVGDKFFPRGWELVEVLTKFLNRGIQNVEVVFIGSGTGLDALRRYVSAKGVEKFCTFTGFVSNEKYHYFLKSLDVGFMEDYDNIQYKTSVGAKVQEYMASGKIVVTGSNPEKLHLLVPSQGNELLFVPQKLTNDEEINKYVDQTFAIFWKIYKDYDKIRLAGIRNEERALMMFDYPVVADLVAALYREIRLNLRRL